MSTKNYPLNVGLAAIGLIWTSAIAADAQEAVPPIPALTSAPAPSNAPKFAVLLMSNGRIIQGSIAMDKTGEEYQLFQKGGTIRFSKRDVECRFDSLRQLYDYKVANLAPRDASELMQLAQWCLENHMNVEAKTQLQALLALNPKNPQAERMIATLDATAERTTEARDPEVKTTSATVTAEPVPRETYSAPLPRVRGDLGRAISQPVVFDLPPAEARKRAIVFAQYVHPVLQQACASCHNSKYQGDFQLIQPTNRREWTSDVVRINLDATLRLVDRDEPLQSLLLECASTPHGPNPKAIVHGPNDPRYRTLSLWLTSLKTADSPSKPGASDLSTAPFGAMPSPGAESFGGDRQAGRPVANLAASPSAANFDGIPKAKRSTEVLKMDADSPNVPVGTKFETPFLPGGALPTLPKRAVRPASPPVVQVNPESALPTLGSEMPAVPVGANASALPSLPSATPVPPPDGILQATGRTTGKKQKLDPALLEQLLKNRQQQP